MYVKWFIVIIIVESHFLPQFSIVAAYSIHLLLPYPFLHISTLELSSRQTHLSNTVCIVRFIMSPASPRLVH